VGGSTSSYQPTNCAGTGKKAGLEQNKREKKKKKAGRGMGPRSTRGEIYLQFKRTYGCKTGKGGQWGQGKKKKRRKGVRGDLFEGYVKFSRKGNARKRLISLLLKKKRGRSMPTKRRNLESKEKNNKRREREMDPKTSWDENEDPNTDWDKEKEMCQEGTRPNMRWSDKRGGENRLMRKRPSKTGKGAIFPLPVGIRDHNTGRGQREPLFLTKGEGKVIKEKIPKGELNSTMKRVQNRKGRATI